MLIHFFNAAQCLVKVHGAHATMTMGPHEYFPGVQGYEHRGSLKVKVSTQSFQ